jgi:hypothetical protein
MGPARCLHIVSSRQLIDVQQKLSEFYFDRFHAMIVSSIITFAARRKKSQMQAWGGVKQDEFHSRLTPIGYCVHYPVNRSGIR